MCNKLSFVSNAEKIISELGITPEGLLRTSYNIGPTQHAYIITNLNRNQLEYVTWGLIPYWSNTGANEGKLSHARAEGIETSSSFRIPIRSRRCLILTDSFYILLEGKNPGNREAYRFFMKDASLMILAGVWDSWYKDEYEVKSFSIIMVPESEIWPWRMPVIFDSKTLRDKWISDLKLEEALDMIEIPDKEMLSYYRVSEELLNSNENSFELHIKKTQ